MMDGIAYQVLTREEMVRRLEAARRSGQSCYVYGLCRGDTTEIFYCGKGRGFRVFQHEKDHEKEVSHKAHIIRKHGVAGYVLFSVHETDAEAFEAEKLAISRHRPVANELPGGEGFDAESARRYATAIQAGRTKEERSEIAQKAHATLARKARRKAASAAARKAHETIAARKRAAGG